jgi:hypothetical protein
MLADKKARMLAHLQLEVADFLMKRLFNPREWYF